MDATDIVSGENSAMWRNFIKFYVEINLLECAPPAAALY